MECNRDEASRAKEIAERKFTEKDIAGAKKFALKAQNLYPGLDGLSQMLATLDVHLFAEKKINGEFDWYGIFGVNPSADDETIKKQYRKLALMLHPDKNKSVGADGAFKLISEAWSLLSDRSKRTFYDQKRFPKTSMQKVPTASGGQTVPPGPNGFHNFSSSMYSNMGVKSTTPKGPPMASPAPLRPSKPATFWTACSGCKMQYEYQRIYVNHTLLCPNCQIPFLAVEGTVPPAPPPSNGSKSSIPLSFSQKHQHPNHHVAPGQVPSRFGDSLNQTNFQWGPFSRSAGVGGPAASAEANDLVQQAFEKARRSREEAQAAKKREAFRKKSSKRGASNNAGSVSDLGGDRPPKKRNIDEGGRPNYFGVNISDPRSMGNGGIGTASGSGFKQGGFERDRASAFSFNKPNSTKDLTQIELRNMLAETAKKELRMKLSEYRAEAAIKAAEKQKRREKEAEEKKKQKQKAAVAGNGDAGDKKKLVESVDPKKTQDRKPSLDRSDADMDSEHIEPVEISVPDPDFHEFDKDRTERSFAENQVWAVYDDDDGMPRYYAIIHKVVSLKPFKVRISWLNSKTNSELGPMNWVGCGFPKTCGDFRVGKHEVNDSLNTFSHKVSWTKGVRGAIQIFPKKGDVWALYRNWSTDWDELTADEVVHKYDMVEVLDDCNEQGVSVKPLAKVAGFKTVFHQHMGPKEVKRIPREEMFRFSHQVPSYLLTGSETPLRGPETPSAPKGCRELDPASTPLELLQIITEAEEKQMTESVQQSVTDVKMSETVENSTEKIEDQKKAGDDGGQVKVAVKDNESVGSVERPVRKEGKRVLDNIKKTYTRRH